MAKKKPVEAFMRVSIANGSTIFLREHRTTQQIAQQLEKQGFVKTKVVHDANDEGAELVLMKSAVLMLAPHTLSMFETGIVRITSVPSKTRN
jgi:hypothetical protein